MEQQFAQFISDQQLVAPGDHLILAVSGGVDSVVMAHLFRKSGIAFSLAHVNYQLRDTDSDADQDFVEQLAKDLQVKCHSRVVDTLKYADSQGISIQMAARDLRYQWFEELLLESTYQGVATAHHQTDVVETMLMNLTKGTGVRGLHGIPLRRGPYIRPLLFATKDQIIAYATAQKLRWREDLSNQDNYYQRNLLRNHVLPLLKQINPHLEATFKNTSEIMRDTEEILKQRVAGVRDQVQTQRGNDIYFDLSLLTAQPLIVWYELLHPFGFNKEQIQSLHKGQYGQSGQIYYSNTHQLNLDRAQLILSPRLQESSPGFIIEDPNDRVWQHHQRQWSLKTLPAAKYQVVRDPQVGAWDLAA